MIWKTPDQKPEENKLIFAQHDRRRDGNIDYFIWDIHEFIDAICKDSIRWCYLDDLIAQADKAERLQKAVEYVYKLFLEEASFTAGAHLPNKYRQKIFEVIKQAIKGE